MIGLWKGFSKTPSVGVAGVSQNGNPHVFHKDDPSDPLDGPMYAWRP